jgi:hypothetical protein
MFNNYLSFHQFKKVLHMVTTGFLHIFHKKFKGGTDYDINKRFIEKRFSYQLVACETHRHQTGR